MFEDFDLFVGGFEDVVHGALLEGEVAFDAFEHGPEAGGDEGDEGGVDGDEADVAALQGEASDDGEDEADADEGHGGDEPPGAVDEFACDADVLGGFEVGAGGEADGDEDEDGDGELDAAEEEDDGAEFGVVPVKGFFHTELRKRFEGGRW